MSVPTVEEEYENVKTFDDLLKINIKFLNGTYDHTCYYCTKINDETLPLVDNLKIINKLGFYTYDGQPSTLI